MDAVNGVEEEDTLSYCSGGYSGNSAGKHSGRRAFLNG